MTQETGGAPAPVTDAPASQAEQQTEVEVAKPGSEADPSPAAPESDKPKPVKSGEQLRIDELTRRYREEQRRSDRLMRMLEERGQPTPQAPQPPQEATPAEKGLADFNYDEKAYAKYQRERAIAESRDELKKTLREEREALDFQQRVNAHNARVAKFQQTAEDFDPDTARSEMPFIHRDMADAILDSEESAAVEYYLWKNQEVARNIAAMSPARAGRAIERIEQALVAERKRAAEKPVSKAPQPAPRIEGAGDGSTKAKPDDPASDADLSDAEWTRRRNAQIAARQRARS